MPLGPFDRRAQRSRCTQCAASHSKCSGERPCSRCQKRRTICIFSAAAPSAGATWKTRAIVIDKGRHLSSGSFAPPERLFSDATVTYLQHFDLFIQRNSFTGRKLPFLADVQNVAKASGRPGQQSDGSHLLNAMLALGAVQAHAVRPRGSDLRFALEAYAKSITQLRTAVTESAVMTKASVLWSTFFLGLFELMQDASGQRWLQHMVFGTSRALTAIGPSKIMSGPLRSFFAQIRAFEVCRSIIFNETSFMSSPAWLAASRAFSEKSVPGGESLLDEILEVVVMCANLRVRTAVFVNGLQEEASPEDLRCAIKLAEEGCVLRQTLETWHIRAAALDDTSPDMLLASSYHAAVGIYLSGNFDYELQHWTHLEMEVPILAAADVAAHLETIIRCTTAAFKTTDLSPVLFLFPLRVAGARAYEEWQQAAVAELLEMIKMRFLAADAFLSDLKSLWASRLIG